MPEGVLGEIARHKRSELETRFANVSLHGLRMQARRTGRSLTSAIARPGTRFILEIKKASPSGGAIRPEADAGSIARGYSGVADALSVLTDSRFFGGSRDDLAAARREFDGPILAKDFFLDPRQVVEARLCGADAVLVMLSLLDNEEARALIAEARQLGMDALVEVHDDREMQRALALRAPLIGINNRDLRGLTVNLAITERLARMAPGRVIVSESGIHARDDVRRLAPHADGFLVGTSLMRSGNPAVAARDLVFGRVKLCGIRRQDDLRAGRAAAFAGFVFVPGTPRHLTAEEAAPLAGSARRSGMLPVGIFRDAPLPIVAELATLMNLHAVQLHGREEADYVRALRRLLPSSCEIWTAVDPVRGPRSGRGGDRLLFDNGGGGSGRSFDWSVIEAHPQLSTGLLAGGIGPHNVRRAAELGAFAIDVGSGVDQVPGVKSPAKVGALFEALRANCRQAAPCG